MARSLATAIVRPSGSKDACATQDAIMAPLAPPRSAVTTYRPPLTRASALAMSPLMDSFDLAILSCARGQDRMSFLRDYSSIRSAQRKAATSAAKTPAERPGGVEVRDIGISATQHA